MIFSVSKHACTLICMGFHLESRSNFFHFCCIFESFFMCVLRLLFPWIFAMDIFTTVKKIEVKNNNKKNLVVFQTRPDAYLGIQNMSRWWHGKHSIQWPRFMQHGSDVWMFYFHCGRILHIKITIFSDLEKKKQESKGSAVFSGY